MDNENEQARSPETKSRELKNRHLDRHARCLGTFRRAGEGHGVAKQISVSRENRQWTTGSIRVWKTSLGGILKQLISDNKALIASIKSQNRLLESLYYELVANRVKSDYRAADNESDDYDC
jgi:hypothetical protein